MKKKPTIQEMKHFGNVLAHPDEILALTSHDLRDMSDAHQEAYREGYATQLISIRRKIMIEFQADSDALKLLKSFAEIPKIDQLFAKNTKKNDEKNAKNDAINEQILAILGAKSAESALSRLKILITKIEHGDEYDNETEN